MSEITLTELRANLDRYLSRIVNTAKKASRMAFNSAGIIPAGTIKEWYGTTTSVNGVWTVDISSAGFTQIMHVDPQPIYNSNTFNNQVYPSVNTVSLTSVTGRVSTGAPGLFNSDTLIMAPNCTVMVKVTGQ